MNFTGRALAAVALALTSACAIITWTDSHVPVQTGLNGAEIDRTGALRLHFERASLMVSIPDKLSSETALFTVVVVPIPVPRESVGGPATSAGAQGAAKVRFCIAVQAKGEGIEFEPMKTVLRSSTNEEIHPLGYLKDYCQYYAGVVQLSSDARPVQCSLNTEFSIVYDRPYDPTANYVLDIAGLAIQGNPVKIPPISFVPKRRYFTDTAP